MPRGRLPNHRRFARSSATGRRANRYEHIEGENDEDKEPEPDPETEMWGNPTGNSPKSPMRSAGLDAEEFSGHSLRAGFVTSTAERGTDLNRIVDQTLHIDSQGGEV